MFELQQPTRAIVTSVTPRSEKHGNEDTPAVSFGLKITGPNTLLEQFEPGLTAIFYRANEQESPQGEFDATKVVHLPRLRSAAFERVTLKGCLNGWAAELEDGITGDSAAAYGSCKVDDFWFVPREGGSIELHLRVGTSDIDARSSGWISVRVKNEIDVRLIAPKPGASTSPTRGQADLIDDDQDGDDDDDFIDDETDDAEGGTKPPQTETENRKSETSGAWPFPPSGATPTEPPPQSATTGDEVDALYDQAVIIVVQHKRASISLVQRHLRIGYNRAARLLEQMEKAGLVSAMSSDGNRDLITPATTGEPLFQGGPSGTEDSAGAGTLPDDDRSKNVPAPADGSHDPADFGAGATRSKRTARGHAAMRAAIEAQAPQGGEAS